MEKLTRKQTLILKFIDEHLEKTESAPSFREIAHHFGFSSLGTVSRHVQTLKKKGALQQKRYHARGLIPSSSQKAPIAFIPLIGILKPGELLETFAQVEEHPVAWQWNSSSDKAYLLQVGGGGFLEENFLAGDLLLIDGEAVTCTGRLALVLIGKRESFIKGLWKQADFLRLESSNPDVRPMIFRADNVEIQGTLLALFRRL